MKKLSVLTLIFLLCFSIFSQESPRNYFVHVGDKPFQIEGTLVQNWEKIHNNPENVFEDDKIVLLQFNAIPSTRDKASMLDNGIELLKYIPNYSWVVRIKTSSTIEFLIANNVRNITEINPDWKISPELKLGNIPHYAGSINEVNVNVLFFTPPKHHSYASILNQYQVKINPDNNILNSVSLNASWITLLELANHPLVQYIEFVDPPIEIETILEESERIMSTYISNNPAKNYFFNGAGVEIAVDESGILNPVENPNFRSRIDRSFENGSTPEAHKTNVGMRMAKAGNIDPTEEGTAFGATLFSGGFSTQDAATNGINIVNRSYGWGCPGGPETYSGSSSVYDYYIRTFPNFMITHSAGNDGGGTCYAGIPGWGNITGMAKMAKNMFNVGASGDNGQLTGFSSRGPAKDGRILPHIVAPGQGGTSYASPNLAGVFAQLFDAYRFHNGNTEPKAGLLKAVIMNTADDMLNPGPDFKTGFGHVNARRAYEVIREGNYMESSISNGAINNHSISVPANLKELKVMVYWVDWEATAGISSRSLVNDLDILLTDPNAVSYQPWVLNPTFNASALNQLPVRATDSLNNSEQITISDPMAGVYQLNVEGTMVPQGPQSYFVTYEFVYDDITVTHPHGGEKFVPNENQRIRWDAIGNGQSFNISYSQNNGASWTIIANSVGGNERYFDWDVPQDLTNQALIKVERGNINAQSDTTFSISKLPENLSLAWSCADSSLFSWDELSNADAYLVYRIIGNYMDSVNITTTNSIVLNGLSANEIEYVSIAPISNGVLGRRVVAVERPPSDLNCNSDDIGISQMVNPASANLPSCMSSDLRLDVNIRNWGINDVNILPIGYQVNGGAIILDTVFANIPTAGDTVFSFLPSFNLSIGNNTIKVWTHLNIDNVPTNDTLIKNVFVFSSMNAGPNLTQNFDNFSNCSTAWDCELVTCNLQDGWYNVTNGAGDDIDWRTHDGSTGSANTGPTSDHTSGAGKYLYIEGSGPCNSSTAQLVSPCLDLTGVNNAQLSFWYHAYGSNIGELHVDAIADGVFYEDIMTPIIGGQGNLWKNEIVDLSQFSNQNLVLIFRGSNGPNGWESDLAIDDINISTSPIAEYAVNETKICAEENVVISNTSEYATFYAWSFQPNTVTYEAGTNSNSANPEVSFDTSGWYTIELIATNAIGDDTLTYVDHIFVFPEQIELSGNIFCEDDSVIVQANDFGVTANYYLNGSIVYSGTDTSYHFENAVNLDEIYISYEVNSNCTIYSDTLIVEITSVNAGITKTGAQLNAVAIGAQYQWLDCLDNYSPILGETNQTFTPLFDGEFAVEVTENGCTKISDCIEYYGNDFFNYTSDSINMFPNPTKGGVTLQFGAIKEFVDVQVYSILGQLLEKITAQNTAKIEVDLPEPAAVYMIHVESEGVNRVFRIVKN